MEEKGCVIWLTGLAGSGKTTLGQKLYEHIKSGKNRRAEFIDGDLTRKFFDDNLGYSRPERIQNIKRIVFASMLLARNGVTVIVANIAPYYEVRDFIRKNIGSYCQVYLKAPLEKCKISSKKALYQGAENGTVKHVIGIDDIYEEPRNPDLIVETHSQTADESFKKMLNFLKKKRLV